MNYYLQIFKVIYNHCFVIIKMEKIIMKMLVIFKMIIKNLIIIKVNIVHLIIIKVNIIK